MKRKNTDHVVLGNDSFRCLHCGEEYKISMPCGTETFLGAGSGFAKDHAGCKPSARGRARFEYATVEEWLRSWDTGASSMAIYNHMSGRPGKREAIPFDPADFGRCVRLLDVAGAQGLGWRERMPEMESIPAWKRVAAAWPELERIYAEDLPSGSSPRLFARLQELRR